MKRKWLKVLIVAMMAGASFGSPMNPKEIEELMYIMNQTRIEWTVPDEDDTGKRDGLLNPPISGGWREDDSIGCVEKLGVTCLSAATALLDFVKPRGLLSEKRSS